MKVLLRPDMGKFRAKDSINNLFLKLSMCHFYSPVRDRETINIFELPDEIVASS